MFDTAADKSIAIAAAFSNLSAQATLRDEEPPTFVHFQVVKSRESEGY